MINDLKADISLLLSKIDTFLLLHLSGGDPLLYPDIAELIVYIAQNFKHKLGRLEMNTYASDYILMRIFSVVKARFQHVLKFSSKYGQLLAVFFYFAAFRRWLSNSSV